MKLCIFPKKAREWLIETSVESVVGAERERGV